MSTTETQSALIADLSHEITALHATEQNLMAQLADSQTEAVALRATEQNLRIRIAELEAGKPWICACGAALYIDSDGAPRSKATPGEQG